MTADQHRSDIAIAIANQTVNQLVAALAEARAEIELLTAKLAEAGQKPNS